MLIISLIVATLVVLVVNWMAYKSGRMGEACGLAVGSVLLGWPCVMLPAVALNGLLLAAIGVVCWLAPAWRRYFPLYSCAALLISHGVVACFSFAEVRDLEQLRQEFPAQSLTQRLAYEKVQAAETVAMVSASPRVDQRLAQQEDVLETRPTRAWMLQRLHEGSVSDFINSPGFGISRNIRPSRRYVELPEATPIPLPASGASNEPVSPGPVPASPAGKLGPMPAETELDQLHQDSVLDFVNPNGFGYVEDREHVIGFQPHQFHAMPELATANPGSDRWRIQRLELLSLLTHDEPVAYLSEHLPRMDELGGAPTRPLTPFERTALAALRSGKDLETEASNDQIDMLGSIRALKQCTACHSVQRGVLLGAFSYVLLRESGKRAGTP